MWAKQISASDANAPIYSQVDRAGDCLPGGMTSKAHFPSRALTAPPNLPDQALCRVRQRGPRPRPVTGDQSPAGREPLGRGIRSPALPLRSSKGNSFDGWRSAAPSSSLRPQHRPSDVLFRPADSHHIVLATAPIVSRGPSERMSDTATGDGAPGRL